MLYSVQMGDPGSEGVGSLQMARQSWFKRLLTTPPGRLLPELPDQSG